jgi:hypothetical protein
MRKSIQGALQRLYSIDCIMPSQGRNDSVLAASYQGVLCET